MTNPTHASPGRQVKSLVQKAAIRLIGSELDRRSRLLERAVTDVNARIALIGQTQETLSTQIEATNDYVRRVHEHLADVEAAHNRLMALHATTSGRLDTTAAAAHEAERDLAALSGEFAGLREAVARVDRLLETRP